MHIGRDRWIWSLVASGTVAGTFILAFGASLVGRYRTAAFVTAEPSGYVSTK